MENNRLTTPSMLNMNTEDIDAAVKYCLKRFDNPDFYGVGISMGANFLAWYNGMKGEDTPFKAIVC